MIRSAVRRSRQRSTRLEPDLTIEDLAAHIAAAVNEARASKASSSARSEIVEAEIHLFMSAHAHEPPYSRVHAMLERMDADQRQAILKFFAALMIEAYEMASRRIDDA